MKKYLIAITYTSPETNYSPAGYKNPVYFFKWGNGEGAGFIFEEDKMNNGDFARDIKEEWHFLMDGQSFPENEAKKILFDKMDNPEL